MARLADENANHNTIPHPMVTDPQLNGVRFYVPLKIFNFFFHRKKSNLLLLIHTRMYHAISYSMYCQPRALFVVMAT